MGRVLLGASVDGRLVAVKQVHPGFAHDDGFRSRFRREVEASRMVSGAYTAAVMDADPDADTPWLASVFVAGPSLRDVVDSAGPLPVDSVRLLAAGLASALTDIHRVGLIHRDLKPSNVLLAEDGARVIDFGIARAADGSSELTHTGSLIGSPAFMSPEQAGGKQLTPASDIFSLGVLLVMAATGQSPFQGTSTPQTIYNVVHSAPDLSNVPPYVRRLAEPCLTKDPGARPTATQILDFVGPVAPGRAAWPPPVYGLIAGQQNLVHTALTVAPPVAQPPRSGWWSPRRALGIAAGAACAVAIAATGVAVLVDEQPRPKPVPSPTTVDQRLQQVSMEQLRLVDPCRLLDTEYLGTFGAVGSPDPHDWSTCQINVSTDAQSDSAAFAVGVTALDTYGWQVTSERVHGLPVVREQGDDDCSVGALVSDEPSVGVYARRWDGRGQACAQAEKLLGGALRKLARQMPTRDRVPGSLVGWDPCSVAGPEVRAAVTRDTGQGTVLEPRAPHGCDWRGSRGFASLLVDDGSAFRPAEYTRVTVAGETGYQGVPYEGSCEVQVPRRSEQPQPEVVTISFSPVGENGKRARTCAAARSIATAILPRIPRE